MTLNELEKHIIEMKEALAAIKSSSKSTCCKIDEIKVQAKEVKKEVDNKVSSVLFRWVIRIVLTVIAANYTFTYEVNKDLQIHERQAIHYKVPVDDIDNDTP